MSRRFPRWDPGSALVAPRRLSTTNVQALASWVNGQGQVFVATGGQDGIIRIFRIGDRDIHCCFDRIISRHHRGIAVLPIDALREPGSPVHRTIVIVGCRFAEIGLARVDEASGSIVSSDNIPMRIGDTNCNVTKCCPLGGQYFAVMVTNGARSVTIWDGRRREPIGQVPQLMRDTAYAECHGLTCLAPPATGPLKGRNLILALTSDGSRAHLSLWDVSRLLEAYEASGAIVEPLRGDRLCERLATAPLAEERGQHLAVWPSARLGPHDARSDGSVELARVAVDLPASIARLRLWVRPDTGVVTVEPEDVQGTEGALAYDFLPLTFASADCLVLLGGSVVLRLQWGESAATTLDLPEQKLMYPWKMAMTPTASRLPSSFKSVFRVSAAEEMNPRFRATMEDAFVAVDGFGGQETSGFFGVYDGHGGRFVADYLRKHLHDNIARELAKKGTRNEEDCLRAAYLLTDIECSKTGEAASGSTSVTCLVMHKGPKRYVYTANCGDARAVLCHAGRAVRLSKDHKATDATEVERIRGAGGFVARGRVVGVLAVARSFGDFAFKQYVSAEPFTSTTKIDARSQFLIIACDGIWDVLSDQDAVDVVREHVGAGVDGSKPSIGKAVTVARVLIDAAISRGSTDNVTALVVFL